VKFFCLGLVALAIFCCVEPSAWQAIKSGGWAGVLVVGCFAAWVDYKKARS